MAAALAPPAGRGHFCVELELALFGFRNEFTGREPVLAEGAEGYSHVMPLEWIYLFCWRSH